MVDLLQVDVVDPQRARIGLQQASDQVDQGCLAGTRWPGDHGQLSVRDLEVLLLEHRVIGVSVAEPVEMDRAFQHRFCMAARGLARGAGLVDCLMQGPECTLRDRHVLQCALCLGQQRDDADQQEYQHHDFGQRHAQAGQHHHQGDCSEDNEQAFLQGLHRFLGNDLLAQRVVQAAGLARDHRVEAVFARHRLERLDRGQLVGHDRQDLLEQAGLLAPGATGLLHQPVQPDQDHDCRQHCRQGHLPGDQQRKPEIDQRRDQLGRHQGALQVAFRGALGFGGHGVGKASDGLGQVVAPATGNHRAHQVQTQVRGHLGHGIADLAIGQQHGDRLEQDHQDAECEQPGQGRRDAEAAEYGLDDLLGQRGIAAFGQRVDLDGLGFAGQRNQRQHGRKTQAVEQACDQQRAEYGDAATGVAAKQRTQHFPAAVRGFRGRQGIHRKAPLRIRRNRSPQLASRG